MRVKLISTTCIAMVFSTCTLTAQANNGDADHRWMPQQPANHYWQAPNWTSFSTPPDRRSEQPANRRPVNRGPVYNNNYRPPVAPVYRPPQPAYNYPPQNTYRPNMNRAAPPVQSFNRDKLPPAPTGPYRGTRNFGADNGASAFNTPGYNSHYQRRNQGRNNNKFWGRSGPGTWMNPNKRNMESGWDDMINSPSRMGEMPGGWTAPEVTMPNPVDMGDQMQDNVQDLPEQMKNMDVGDDIK